MNLSQLEKLENPDSFKLISYLVYLHLKDQEFNIPKIKRTYSLDTQEIFTALSELFEVNIIDILCPENSENPDLYIKFVEVKLQMNISQYTDTTLELLLKTVFKDRSIIEYVYNNIINPLGLLQDFNIDRLLASPEEKLKNSKEDKLYRQRISRNAQRIHTAFIELLKSHKGIVLPQSQDKIERHHAKLFATDYISVPIETIREGIEFFLLDSYWGDKMLSISTLRKHFHRFLAKHNLNKAQNLTGIKIL